MEGLLCLVLRLRGFIADKPILKHIQPKEQCGEKGNDEKAVNAVKYDRADPGPLFFGGRSGTGGASGIFSPIHGHPSLSGLRTIKKVGIRLGDACSME